MGSNFMNHIENKKLKTIAGHFRDTIIFAALATVALGVAEFSFVGSTHIANIAFGTVAALACAGLLALTAANVALIVGEVRNQSLN